MVELLNQKNFRNVRNLPFCYLCGKTFNADDCVNRDHLPPESIFASEHREPLLLPTHLKCNKAHELTDEKIGQLIALRYGKVPSHPKHRRLKFTVTPSLNLGAVTNVNVDAAVWRWIAGFHAALYREPAVGIRGALVTPFPKAQNISGRLVAEPLKPQHLEFVKTIRTNRIKGNLDRIRCNKGKVVYECVWCQSRNDGPWLCIFALDIYDWKDLGDTGQFPARGCAGFYTLPLGGVPVDATRGTGSSLIIPMKDPLDPFAD